jgi:hypothetical protein
MSADGGHAGALAYCEEAVKIEMKKNLSIIISAYLRRL